MQLRFLNPQFPAQWMFNFSVRIKGFNNSSLILISMSLVIFAFLLTLVHLFFINFHTCI